MASGGQDSGGAPQNSALSAAAAYLHILRAQEADFDRLWAEEMASDNESGGGSS